MIVTGSILVTGGTGALGRLVVPLLRGAGRDVRMMSRTADGPDVIRGDLESADLPDLGGFGTVLHLAGSAKGDGRKAGHLVAAARLAGVRHLVLISVVGADRVPVVSGIDRAGFGYYQQKRFAEQAVAGSGLPWTTLRATQFHELTLTVVRQLARLPVIPVPAGVRFQPVDGAEVAARLAELTLGEPAGLVPPVAGPRIYPMASLVRSYLTAIGRRRPILPVRFTGGAYRAIRSGANLAPDRAVGERTWEDFLAAEVGRIAAFPGGYR
jgi:uncharacterized protein YbjT (DUF2867 family)